MTVLFIVWKKKKKKQKEKRKKPQKHFQYHNTYIYLNVTKIVYCLQFHKIFHWFLWIHTFYFFACCLLASNLGVKLYCFCRYFNIYFKPFNNHSIFIFMYSEVYKCVGGGGQPMWCGWIGFFCCCSVQIAVTSLHRIYFND